MSTARMRTVGRGIPSRHEEVLVMPITVIGVDPHKRSHTAVVLDAAEQIDSQVHVLADRRQVDRLLAWANPWPQRIWAIESVYGMGKLLSQQLLRRGGQ